MAARSQPHFCCVIFRRAQLCQLKIPDQYVSKHGNILPDHVCLQAPRGEMWPVEMVKQEGEILLGKGWPEFAAHYSIRICHFIVFQYDWSSCFHVFIFNEGATEIDYPTNILPQMVNVDVTEIVDDDEYNFSSEDDESSSVEILPSGCFEKLEQSALGEDQYGNPSTREKADQCGRKKIGAKRKKVVPPILKNDVKHKVLKRAAAAFKSNKPHFFVFMSPSYIYTNHMCIPSSHATGFFKSVQGEKKVLLYRIREGKIKTWTVDYGFAHSKSRGGRYRKARLCSGWLDFVGDNKLRVGDVCIFELTDPVAKWYEVRVYHDNDDCNFDSNDSSSIQILEDYSSGCLKKEKQEITTTFGVEAKQRGTKKCKVMRGDVEQMALQRAAAFKSTKPHFFIGMSPSYIHRNYLYIPLSHSVVYFKSKKGEKKVLLRRYKDGETKTWTVGYGVTNIRARQMQVRLGTGWINFVRGNKLQVGDVCIFEMIDPVELVCEVSVYRVNDHDDDDDWRVLKHKSPAAASRLDNDSPLKRRRIEPKSAGNQPEREGRIARRKAPKRLYFKGSKRTSRSIQQKSVMQRANAFASENPIFMYPSYASHGNLHIPRSHSKIYFRERGDENVVTLCRKEGSKRWKVKYSASEDTCTVKFCAGWGIFVVENGLKAGDACVFELLDVRDKVYIVTLFWMDESGIVRLR